MQPVSSRWWPAIAAGTCQPYVYCNILSGIGGGIIAGPLFCDDGYGTWDQTNVIRRTITRVKFTDPTGALVPSDPSQPLFPDGTLIQPFHGLQYADGTTEVKSLGGFLIEETDADAGVSPGATEIWVSGSDLGAFIGRAKFTQPYATDGVSTTDVAIKAVLAAVLPNTTFAFNFTSTTFVPAIATANIGDDPWAFCCTLAANAGYELFFDPLMNLIFRPVADPSTLPIVNAGLASNPYVQGPGCVITELRHTLTNVPAPNWVIVIAQGSGITTPLRADWQDTDPSSPTYIGVLSNGPGSYPIPGTGKYPLTVQYISTAIPTTQAAVQAYANAIGLAGKGLLDGIIMWTQGNAALEPDDVLAVTLDVAGVRGPRSYVVDSFVFQLGIAQTTKATMRRVA